jgi:hypothetical protein
MITHRRSLEIAAPPERVFASIETDPFPTFAILDTKPFLFIRLALLDGISAARRALAARPGSQDEVPPLELGTVMGPFTVTTKKPPREFHFTLKSFFFNCRTGFSLCPTDGGTLVHFDTVAESPSRDERFWWFFIKPVHALLARRVLRTHRKRALAASRGTSGKNPRASRE